MLQSLAHDLGLDVPDFTTHYEIALAGDAARHIEESREWLQASGGQGFPTFVFEFSDRDSGQRVAQRVDMGPWLGNPSGWQDHLRQGLDAAAAQA
ncbi:hypothetical protein D3C86_1751950 [compost metagenome]